MIESTNVVINNEQCAKTYTKEAQSIQGKSVEVEDTLPKEYVEKSNDEELLILNDTILEPRTLVQENP